MNVSISVSKVDYLCNDSRVPKKKAAISNQVVGGNIFLLNWESVKQDLYSIMNMLPSRDVERSRMSAAFERRDLFRK